MPAEPVRDDYHNLLGGRVPLVDLRAPVEFAQGAPAQAVNLPMLTDVERAAVGSCYQAHGSEVARSLGERLVSGQSRARRIERWIEQLRSEPGLALYCWRGGERSQIAQAWLRDAGHVVPRIDGGIKALRRAGIEWVERFAATRRWIVLGGRTGSGKTDLLRQIGNMIDLEGHANHRGSAFGALPGGQPPQVQFEFDLAAASLELSAAGGGGLPIVVEDEGSSVGAVQVPPPIMRVIRESPVVHLEVDLEVRVRNVCRDYVEEPLRRGDSATRLELTLLAATDRIRKRLGGEQHAAVAAEIRAAFALSGGRSPDAHAAWIRRLLLRYYDPSYDRQMRKQADRVLFRGEFEAVRDYLARGAGHRHATG